MTGDAIVAAAQFERDQRLESYSRRIRAGTAEAETASIDYQCWVAIAEWLETGRFYSFAGGADPDRADAPIIRWPELEQAAETALLGVTNLIDKQEVKAFGDADVLTQLYVRRARLVVVHRKVQLRRQTIDDINREARGLATQGREFA